MKDQLLHLRAFIRKNLVANFVFNFFVFLGMKILLTILLKEPLEDLKPMLLETSLFALIMTPILRYLNTLDQGQDPIELGDHVRHFKVGQRATIKAYLESKGYQSDYNQGAVSYFKSKDENVLSSKQTFIHESDYWIALVADPIVLRDVPDTIHQIYPKNRS